jgi:hypothetical protein
MLGASHWLMMLSGVAAVAVLRTTAARGPMQQQQEEGQGQITSLSFSHHTWRVKDSGHGKAGPGPNYFNRSNAAVDAQGRLHLRISGRRGDGGNSGAGWACAEVYAARALGFGRYRWVLDTSLSAGFGGVAADGGMDPNVVLGLFLYKDDSHELDIEFSRWGRHYGENKTADYAVQPWSPQLTTALHWVEPLHVAATYHQLDWSADAVMFESGRLQADGTAGAVIQRWSFTNASRIPAADGMLPRMNFWLSRGETNMTADARPEVVIRSFQFTPHTTAPPPPAADDEITLQRVLLTEAAKQVGAVALDGTPALYYYKNASNASSSAKWHVYLEGVSHVLLHPAPCTPQAHALAHALAAVRPRATLRVRVEIMGSIIIRTD